MSGTRKYFSMNAFTSNNLYRVRPRAIRPMIIDCLEAGLTPFVRSSPGMGKSEIIASIFDELGLVMIDHRLSTSEPTDLSGLPHFVNGMARFAPFEELFPLQSTPIPKGYQGWGIFFDEFNSASKMVQAASYKTILDRKTGQHSLHDNVVIVCAGNLDTDRAIVNPISTAMQSRVIHLELELDFDDWYNDVALKRQYDPRITSYLLSHKSHLMDFRPDHNETTFCCPRTWDFMNRLIKGKDVTNEKAALYAGTITSGVAVDFVQFTAVFNDLIKVPEIIARFDTCPIPSDNSAKWATISQMIEAVDAKNFEPLGMYANRFTLDFRILFVRACLVRKPELRQHPAFAKVASEIIRYLNS